MSKRLLSVSFHFCGSQADNKADLYCGPLIITLFKKVNNKYFKTLKYVSIPENFREYFFKKIKYRMVTSLISSSTSVTNKAVSISPSVNRIPESLTLCTHAYLNLAQLGWTLFLSSLQALGASPSPVTDFLRHAPRWWLLNSHSSYSPLVHIQSLCFYKAMGRG